MYSSRLKYAMYIACLSHIAVQKQQNVIVNSSSTVNYCIFDTNQKGIPIMCTPLL